MSLAGDPFCYGMPVYFVRSNFPTPGGLFFFSYFSMLSMKVPFLTFRSTTIFLREADFVLRIMSPSTLYFGPGVFLTGLIS